MRGDFRKGLKPSVEGCTPFPRRPILFIVLLGQPFILLGEEILSTSSLIKHRYSWRIIFQKKEDLYEQKKSL